MRWVVLALLLAGCSRPAPSLKVPEPSSRTWTSGRLYFHGHEIVAPLTLTKHDSSLTIQGFHRIRAGTLERTPELVLMQFLPPVPQSPPPADAMPDSNYLVLRAAGASGTLARKRGVSAREAEDSVVAYLNRNGRVKAASTNGYATYIEFKNGESMVIMGDREHRSVPPKPAVLIDGDFKDLSRCLDQGTLVFVVPSGRTYIPDGQRDFSDSLLRHPTAEVRDRVGKLRELLDDSVPLDHFALK